MKYNKAVCNGRYQIQHAGHFAMIKHATEIAETVYVIIGSASAFPNLRNPFRPNQRIDMLSAGFDDYGIDGSRVIFETVDDANYVNPRWEADIRDAIDERKEDKIVMVGYKKDRGSWWLDTFGWDLSEIDEQLIDGKTINATDIRNKYFTNGYIDPKSVSNKVALWLANFAETDEYKRLVHEHAYNNNELSKFASYPYQTSLNCMTGDAVVICNGHLMVTTRGNMPGLGAYALPGGHKDNNETTKECAIRELCEEVRLKVPERVIRGSIKNQKLFDYPNRSYPICKPTLAIYIELLPDFDGSSNTKLPKIKPRDEIRDVQWMPLHMVRRNRHMFFDDHYEIIQFFTGL